MFDHKKEKKGNNRERESQTHKQMHARTRTRKLVLVIEIIYDIIALLTSWILVSAVAIDAPAAVVWMIIDADAHDLNVVGIIMALLSSCFV